LPTRWPGYRWLEGIPSCRPGFGISSPRQAVLVRRLRDTPCTDPRLHWCREQNDPKGLLKHWFGFEAFRPKPTGADGLPLQETIVSSAIAKSPILGILPTGTGKSVCYQLPALAQFTKTGALTVVISPLVALMADQVEGMRRKGSRLRHHQWHAVDAGTAGCPEPGPPGRRRDRADFARAARSPSVRSVLNQSVRSATGCWMKPTASRNGGTIFAPITDTSVASSRNIPETNRLRRSSA
jgi:hypothetical protein